MKTCLWCKENENKVSFDLEAHILPQKLGSKELCEEECDECNQYFGKRNSPKEPSIDIILKETFILSMNQQVNTLLSFQEKIGRKKAKELYGSIITKNTVQRLGRDTEFFSIDSKKRTIKSKRPFKYHLINQTVFTNLIKRGLLKAGFEKAHKAGFLSQLYGGFYSEFYDYIRNYVRWNKGQVKVLYLRKKNGAVYMTVDTAIKPSVLLHDIENNYLKFDILGHVFAVSLGQSNLTEENFLKEYINDIQFQPVKINSFMDIDIFNKVFGHK